MTAPDRLPPIPTDQLTPEQQAVAAEIAAGPRGELAGPFAASIRSPEFTRRLQALGEYLRYRPALEPRLREMVILLTARAWDQAYEWVTHVSTALECGLPRDVVAAIAAGRRPDAMRPDETALYDFVDELRRDRSVSDQTYARAVEALSEQGVVDLVGAIGYYATLAMLMNVGRTPVPAGVRPPVALQPMSIDLPDERR